MDTSIGVSLVLLMAAFVVIALYYLRRQARALAYVAEIEEARLMRQKQLWRREDAAHVLVDDPVAWLGETASAALGEKISILEVRRVLKEVPALETLAAGGRRVVFSPLSARELRQTIGASGWRGRGAAARLERFAQDAPLLGRNPRRVHSACRSLMDDEWLDVKAGRIGDALGVQWGEPVRLWVHVVPTGW